jgi:ABC-type nickel/cobalt efflux system permease component RcnA
LWWRVWQVSHCYYTAVTLLPQCCCTVVHCYYTIVTLLFHCSSTVVTLFLHCCGRSTECRKGVCEARKQVHEVEHIHAHTHTHTNTHTHTHTHTHKHTHTHTHTHTQTHTHTHTHTQVDLGAELGPGSPISLRPIKVTHADFFVTRASPTVLE